MDSNSKEKYSLLERIDMYAQDCGFPFNSIYISSTYFPESFNRVVLRELDELLVGMNQNPEKFIDNYIFTYDGTDKLKMIVCGRNSKIRLVIFPKDCPYEMTVGKRMSEYEIYDMVNDYEYANLLQLRKISKSMGVGNAINMEIVPLSKRMKESTKMCLSYIDFWNKRYQVEQKEERMASMIHYTKPESVGEVRTIGGYGIGTVRNYERVNGILSAKVREDILSSYDYMYKGYSYTDSSLEITHMNYMYQIGQYCYALVIEPYSGEGITRTYLRRTKAPMTQKSFEELVRYVLSIPYKELLRRDNIIITYHTSLESFDENLSIILRGVSKYNLQNNNSLKIRQKVNKNFIEYYNR